MQTEDRHYTRSIVHEKGWLARYVGCARTVDSDNWPTSGVLEHKWRASLKTILFLLTSNTEATENKVKFLNLAYRVKGFQCHSNNSLQLLELKEKTTTTKQYTLFKSFLCDIL